MVIMTYTVKPEIFAFPLFREFRDLGKFAKITGRETTRIWRAGRPAVFLQQRYLASPGVRLPSVALKSQCRADEGTGVAAALCRALAHHLSRRRLYHIADQSRA